MNLGTLISGWVHSLSEAELTPAPPLRPSAAMVDSEFDRTTGSFPPWLPNQYLYPTTGLRPGCSEEHFERNQRSLIAISISLLAPGHVSDLNLSISIGPPSGFRRTSPCQGLDRQASGLIPVTVGSFKPDGLAARSCCAILAFATGTGITLATKINSLPRVSARATKLL